MIFLLSSWPQNLAIRECAGIYRGYLAGCEESIGRQEAGGVPHIEEGSGKLDTGGAVAGDDALIDRHLGVFPVDVGTDLVDIGKDVGLADVAATSPQHGFSFGHLEAAGTLAGQGADLEMPGGRRLELDPAAISVLAALGMIHSNHADGVLAGSFGGLHHALQRIVRR